MIVYLAEKTQFLADVDSNKIDEVILSAFQRTSPGLPKGKLTVLGPRIQKLRMEKGLTRCNSASAFNGADGTSK